MRRSRRTGTTGLALVAMLAVGALAATQDVTYNAMPGTDFAKYKTYKWVEIKGAEKPDQIVDQQITQAFDAELAKKGLQKTDADSADLYVGYQVAVQQQKEWNAYGMGGGWRFGGGMGTMTSSNIDVGTLGLDIYDSKAKQLIWRGAATKTIDTKADPEKRQKNIAKAVEKMLKNYPPKK